MVVSAKQKDADQRLVVAGVEGCGLAHGGKVERQGRGGAHQGHLARAAQEGAAGVLVGLQQVHGGLPFIS